MAETARCSIRVWLSHKSATTGRSLSFCPTTGTPSTVIRRAAEGRRRFRHPSLEISPTPSTYATASREGASPRSADRATGSLLAGTRLIREAQHDQRNAARVTGGRRSTPTDRWPTTKPSNRPVDRPDFLVVRIGSTHHFGLLGSAFLRRFPVLAKA